MLKLANLTRQEHFFYAVDGSVLKTTHDLFNFLDSCDQETFDYHVTDVKNDFAEWIKSTLLFPELSEQFIQARTINGCKKVLLDFFAAFENQPTGVTSEKWFKTVDGYELKTTHELYYYLNNCSDSNYFHHANDLRNDFSGWVRDILKYPELADLLDKAKSRDEAAIIVREFVTDSPYYRGGAASYNQYLKKVRSEKLNLDPNDPKSKTVSAFLDFASDSPQEKPQEGLQTFTKPESSESKNDLIHAGEAAGTILNLEKNDISLSEPKSSVDLSDSKIPGGLQNFGPPIKNEPDKKDQKNIDSSNLKSKKGLFKLAELLKFKPKDYSKAFETPKKVIVEEKLEINKLDIPERVDDEEAEELKPTFDKNGFRQFTDEELEHFVKFSKKDSLTESDLKVEYLKSSLEELKNMIKELRRVEKDPYVADLMVRSLGSKIDFYALSKDGEDYNKIIKEMKEVQKELEFCLDQKPVNFAHEVMKSLELEGLALKKSHAEVKSS